ncbi:MAG: hypothetical protein OXM01_01585, partial [Gemmatimonadota bacterium]|nr:hypothetical protein [Gemmatimonadota bacterium]
MLSTAASLAIIGIAAFVLLCIVIVMAVPQLRLRLVGDSPLANAAIPIIASALVGVGSWSGSLLASAISDASAPESTLRVFIEDIRFGLPEIPGDYAERSLKPDEIDELLSVFANSTEVIRLTEAEVEALNAISLNSAQAGTHPVWAEGSYTMQDVATNFKSAFGFYYEYVLFEKTTDKWRTFLEDNKDNEPGTLMKEFSEKQVFPMSAAPMLFRGFNGMAALGKIDLDEYRNQEESCKSDPDITKITLIPADELGLGELGLEAGLGELVLGGSYELSWGKRFGSHLVSERDGPDRVRAAKRFAHWMSHACIDILIDVFKKMEGIFGSEAKYMKQYLQRWNEVLAARKSKLIEVMVTVSNVGKFDTYVRREVSAAIGGQGGSEKIPFTLIHAEAGQSGKEGDSLYQHVKSRSANTLERIRFRRNRIRRFGCS